MAATFILVLSLVVITPARPAPAATTAFAVRFHTNDNGAIVTIGNNLETCPSSASTCARAQAATNK
jgi:hypothetical protein